MCTLTLAASLGSSTTRRCTLSAQPFHLVHKFTTLMSQTTSTAAASSRFQLIFNAALKSYQKQTKKDLIAHPLASQLQSCDSTSAILAVLQEQVRQFDQAHSGDERFTKWLIPTVNVLYAFSAAVSEGVGLVSLYVSTDICLSDVYFVGVFTCESDLCRHWCPPFSEYPIYCLGESF